MRGNDEGTTEYWYEEELPRDEEQTFRANVDSWDSVVLQIDWEHAAEADSVVPLKVN